VFSEDIALLTESIESDDFGQQIISVTETIIQADKKSVTRSEFYQAANTDLKPEIVFDVHSFEYSNERFLRWNSREYSVLRAFEHVRNGLNLTELVCEHRVGHG